MPGMWGVRLGHKQGVTLMANQLATQAQFQAVLKRTFCYLCARSFQSGEAQNRDHVPPSKLFAAADRSPALILPTHVACNHARSAEDEVITQLVGVLHGRPIARRGRKPKFVIGTFPDGSLGIGASSVDLKTIIFRWVCGFHAALYHQPMGASHMMVFPPFPEARMAGPDVEHVSVPEVVPHLVHELKRNRLTRTLDSIVCRNGRCRYECVWSQADDGRRICIWALDLYAWKELGDVTHFEPRGCVGVYSPDDGVIPPSASLGARLHFTVPSEERLDPFGR